eukprot:TRINITY_DN13961_c1_g4_i2.p1 TRINITY_DN13961_c1_g4~~TRINITY_DN13961_c1_g4_i2.p1  ORF type:complete len:1619 (-),score=369.43 TRINITY_DN13961_c1_g4_i2:128-4984(-)
MAAATDEAAGQEASKEKKKKTKDKDVKADEAANGEEVAPKKVKKKKSVMPETVDTLNNAADAGEQTQDGVAKKTKKKEKGSIDETAEGAAPQEHKKEKKSKKSTLAVPGDEAVDGKGDEGDGTKKKKKPKSSKLLDPADVDGSVMEQEKANLDADSTVKKKKKSKIVDDADGVTQDTVVSPKAKKEKKVKDVDEADLNAQDVIASPKAKKEKKAKDTEAPEVPLEDAGASPKAKKDKKAKATDEPEDTAQDAVSSPKAKKEKKSKETASEVQPSSGGDSAGKSANADKKGDPEEPGAEDVVGVNGKKKKDKRQPSNMDGIQAGDETIGADDDASKGKTAKTKGKQAAAGDVDTSTQEAGVDISKQNGGEDKKDEPQRPQSPGGLPKREEVEEGMQPVSEDRNGASDGAAVVSLQVPDIASPASSRRTEASSAATRSVRGGGGPLPTNVSSSGRSPRRRGAGEGPDVAGSSSEPSLPLPLVGAAGLDHSDAAVLDPMDWSTLVDRGPVADSEVDLVPTSNEEALASLLKDISEHELAALALRLGPQPPLDLIDQVLYNLHYIMGLEGRHLDTLRSMLKPGGGLLAAMTSFDFTAVPLQRLQHLRARMRKSPGAFSPEHVSAIDATCGKLASWVNGACYAASSRSWLHPDAVLLDDVEPRHIAEICSFARPPVLVGAVLAHVHLLLGLDTRWTTVQQSTRKAREFIEQLLYFQQEQVTEETLKVLHLVFRSFPEAFAPDEVASVNWTCGVLCTWVNAICRRAGVKMPEVSATRKFSWTREGKVAYSKRSRPASAERSRPRQRGGALGASPGPGPGRAASGSRTPRQRSRNLSSGSSGSSVSIRDAPGGGRRHRREVASSSARPNAAVPRFGAGSPPRSPTSAGSSPLSPYSPRGYRSPAASSLASQSSPVWGTAPRSPRSPRQEGRSVKRLSDVDLEEPTSPEAGYLSADSLELLREPVPEAAPSIAGSNGRATASSAVGSRQRPVAKASPTASAPALRAPAKSATAPRVSASRSSAVSLLSTGSSPRRTGPPSSCASSTAGSRKRLSQVPEGTSEGRPRRSAAKAPAASRGTAARQPPKMQVMEAGYAEGEPDDLDDVSLLSMSATLRTPLSSDSEFQGSSVPRQRVEARQRAPPSAAPSSGANGGMRPARSGQTKASATRPSSSSVASTAPQTPPSQKRPSLQRRAGTSQPQRSRPSTTSSRQRSASPPTSAAAETTCKPSRASGRNKACGKEREASAEASKRSPRSPRTKRVSEADISQRSTSATSRTSEPQTLKASQRAKSSASAAAADDVKACKPPVILRMDVDMGQGRHEAVLVRRGDDLDVVAAQFCKDHKLESRISRVLAQQLAKALEGCEDAKSASAPSPPPPQSTQTAAPAPAKRAAEPSSVPAVKEAALEQEKPAAAPAAPPPAKTAAIAGPSSSSATTSAPPDTTGAAADDSGDQTSAPQMRGRQSLLPGRQIHPDAGILDDRLGGSAAAQAKAAALLSQLVEASATTSPGASGSRNTGDNDVVLDVLRNVHSVLGYKDDWKTIRRNMENFNSFLQEIRYMEEPAVQAQLGNIRKRILAKPKSFNENAVARRSSTCAALCAWLNAAAMRAGMGDVHETIASLQAIGGR